MRVREAISEQDSRLVDGYTFLIVVLNLYHFIAAVKPVSTNMVATMSLAAGGVN
ncbi:MAG: hypothetical protein ACI9WS_003468 [Paraglaciecola psychrophila]|jgi:hypothetical protein